MINYRHSDSSDIPLRHYAPRLRRDRSRGIQPDPQPPHQDRKQGTEEVSMSSLALTRRSTPRDRAHRVLDAQATAVTGSAPRAAQLSLTALGRKADANATRAAPASSARNSTRCRPRRSSGGIDPQ
jgi:hypothetical protein